MMSTKNIQSKLDRTISSDTLPSRLIEEIKSQTFGWIGTFPLHAFHDTITRKWNDLAWNKD